MTSNIIIPFSEETRPHHGGSRLSPQSDHSSSFKRIAQSDMGMPAISHEHVYERFSHHCFRDFNFIPMSCKLQFTISMGEMEWNGMEWTFKCSRTMIQRAITNCWNILKLPATSCEMSGLEQRPLPVADFPQFTCASRTMNRFRVSKEKNEPMGAQFPNDICESDEGVFLVSVTQ
jgi:hypothetical protein